MPMSSCLYECQIWHERRLPRFHTFTAKHFMFYLDLDELGSHKSQSRLLGVNQFNIFSIIERDYLPDESARFQSLVDRVKSTLRKLGVEQEIKRIDLLTNARILGYVFNPVSFYFCFSEAKQLICCLCEVGNTFGEKKVFLVETDSDGLLRKRQKKPFYVSPFTDLNQDFDFRIIAPGENLDIGVDTMDGGTAIVRASLRGKRTALTDGNLLRLLLRYSWATVNIIALIHFHALLLWLKRVPFHRKEESPEMQVDILNPATKPSKVAASRSNKHGNVN
jgi:uncharacterized protein